MQTYKGKKKIDIGKIQYTGFYEQQGPKLERDVNKGMFEYPF